jgi:hypothetical protein
LAHGEPLGLSTTATTSTKIGFIKHPTPAQGSLLLSGSFARRSNEHCSCLPFQAYGGVPAGTLSAAIASIRLALTAGI